MSRRMNWLGLTTHSDEGKCVQDFGGETWKDRWLGRPRNRWKYNIKIGLREIGWETWTEFFWLNEGTCGNCFWSQKWTFGLNKVQEISWLCEEQLALRRTVLQWRYKWASTCMWWWKSEVVLKHLHQLFVYRTETAAGVLQAVNCRSAGHQRWTRRESATISRKEDCLWSADEWAHAGSPGSV